MIMKFEVCVCVICRRKDLFSPQMLPDYIAMQALIS